jgi:LuxR family transcriptional regulator, maltose regulon positive regulatory protein
MGARHPFPYYYNEGSGYWKAYRTSHDTLHRVYLGKAQDLTLDRLNQAAATLAAADAPIGAQHRPIVAWPSTLLATKLFVPPARANLVVRPRLFERVDAGLHHKLTLIAAPAGFGKTTLLSAWRATAAGSALLFGWCRSIARIMTRCDSGAM